MRGQGRKCPYCRGLLTSPMARYCTQCNNWLTVPDWLKNQFNLGDIALYGSLILVLVSSFQNVIWSKTARLEATVFKCGDKSLQVHIVNDGSAPGLIVSGRMRAVTDANTPEWTPFSPVRLDSEQQYSVAPQEAAIYSMTLAGDQITPFMGQASNEPNCRIAGGFQAISRSDSPAEWIETKGSCPCAMF